MAASGYLVCAVYHSHNQKPLAQRLVLKRKA